MINATPETACPLCASGETNVFPIYYLFNERRFQAKRCGACSFVFIDPRPTEKELAMLYRDEYFLHDGTDCGAHSSTDYETAALKGSVKFPEILGWIKKFRSSGDFFEVGCGMGYFLDYVRTNGYRVSGIEYAALGAAACRDRFKLDVEQCSLEEYAGAPERFDVVFMGDVLEHLVRPLEMLMKVRTLLRPSGIVAIEVPSFFNSFVGRLAATGLGLLGIQKKMPMPPYHLNEFTPGTLKEMLTRAGFREPVVIQRIKPPRSITLRGSVMEKTLKKGLQYPNYMMTKATGTFGDRLLGIGSR